MKCHALHHDETEDDASDFGRCNGFQHPRIAHFQRGRLVHGSFDRRRLPGKRPGWIRNLLSGDVRSLWDVCFVVVLDDSTLGLVAFPSFETFVFDADLLWPQNRFCGY